MSMSLNSRREITKMRELLWFFIVKYKVKCFFCKQSILHPDDISISLPNLRLGNGTAPPLELDMTIHHKDEDHDNNDPGNWEIGHDVCHRRHHGSATFKKHRESVAGRRAA